jgi:hypothetical protein
MTEKQLAKKIKKFGYCRTQNCPSGSVHTEDDRMMCSKCYKIYLEGQK